MLSTLGAAANPKSMVSKVLGHTFAPFARWRTASDRDHFYFRMEDAGARPISQQEFDDCWRDPTEHASDLVSVHLTYSRYPGGGAWAATRRLSVVESLVTDCAGLSLSPHCTAATTAAITEFFAQNDAMQASAITAIGAAPPSALGEMRGEWTMPIRSGYLVNIATAAALGGLAWSLWSLWSLWPRRKLTGAAPNKQAPEHAPGPVDSP